MKLWSVPFRVGHADTSVFCKSCMQEAVIRRVTIMQKLFGPTVSYCAFCGSKELEIEPLND